MVHIDKLAAIAVTAIRRHAGAHLLLAPFLVCVSRRAVRMVTKTVACSLGSVEERFACDPLTVRHRGIGAFPFLVFREAAMTITEKSASVFPAAQPVIPPDRLRRPVNSNVGQLLHARTAMVHLDALTAIAAAAIRRHAVTRLLLAPFLVCVPRRAVRMVTKTVACFSGSVHGRFACDPLAVRHRGIGAFPFLVFREAAMTITKKMLLSFQPPNPAFQRTAFGVR